MTVVIVLELRIKETEEIQQESKKVWKLKPELNQRMIHQEIKGLSEVGLRR